MQILKKWEGMGKMGFVCDTLRDLVPFVDLSWKTHMEESYF